MVKHFLKLLAIFLVMIILGLVGVSIINMLDPEAGASMNVTNQIQFAK